MSREGNPKEWLNAAEKDRLAAKHLLDSGDYEACAFHCQQAVEKLLKAVSVKQSGQRPVHTHDLRALLEESSDLKINAAIEEAVSNISGYYVGARYPLDAVDPGAFKRSLAESAVQKMDEIFQWFLAQISFESE